MPTSSRQTSDWQTSTEQTSAVQTSTEQTSAVQTSKARTPKKLTLYQALRCGTSKITATQRRFKNAKIKEQPLIDHPINPKPKVKRNRTTGYVSHLLTLLLSQPAFI